MLCPRSGRSGRFLPFVVAFLVSIAALSAPAQVIISKPRHRRVATGEELYSMEGRVSYRGSAVKGALVIVRDNSGRERARVYTDDSGRFFVPDLPQGTYALTASHPPFQDVTRSVGLLGAVVDIQLAFIGRVEGAAATSAEPFVPVWAANIPSEAQEEFKEGIKDLAKGEKEKGIAHLKAALDIYPEYATARSALGAVYLQTGDTEAAVTAFKEALEIDKNLPEACLGLGSIYSSQGRAEEAESYLLRARRLRGDDWRAHFELGRLYYRVQAWPQAEKSLQRALELKSEFPRTHLFLMNALAYQEKYAEALAAMENFLGLFPDNAFASKVRKKRDLLRTEIEKTPAQEGNPPP